MAFGGGQRYFSGSRPRVSGCVFQPFAILSWRSDFPLRCGRVSAPEREAIVSPRWGNCEDPISCVPSRRRGNREPRFDAAAALFETVRAHVPAPTPDPRCGMKIFRLGVSFRAKLRLKPWRFHSTAAVDSPAKSWGAARSSPRFETCRLCGHGAQGMQQRCAK